MAGLGTSKAGTGVVGRALIALLLLGGAADALAQRTFYVDFANGNDAADGRSPTTAWKRAPGDSQATGAARAMVLAPGDRVLFRGGVRYRGTINLKQSGTADAPIVYDGSGWGRSRAIIDGSNPAAMPQKCPSQAACLGSEHWRNLMMVPVPADTRWSDWLFVGDEAMQIAQWPSVDAYWEYDKVEKMAAIPRAKLTELRAGFIAVPGVPKQLMQGSPVLGQWSDINDIYFARGFEIGDEGISFTNPAYKPYTDRDNRFVIYNAPSEVNAPGKFAISGKDGVAIFWPKNGPQRLSLPGVGVGSRRRGFVFGRTNHVRIRGFSFANFASPQHGDNSDRGAGVPIHSTIWIEHVEIADNAFRSVVNQTREGAIRVSGARHLDIRRNSFEHLPWASAIYVSEAAGPVRVACNTIRNLGRNGVRILNNMHTEIDGNLVDGANGIHGAGINLYLDNRLARVRGNVIRNAQLPLTMHGTSKPFFSTPEPMDFQIADNVFISNDRDGAALSSWGGVHNARIENNFLGSERFALRLRGNERNLVLAGNVTVGSIAGPKDLGFFEDSGNVSLLVDGNGEQAIAEAAQQAPDQSRCSAAAATGSVPSPTMSSMSMGR